MSGVETENETESNKKQSISDSPETTKVSRITEMSDRYQGLRDLGTKNRMIEKDLEVLVDYTQQCDYRSHSVNRIIYKSRMLGSLLSAVLRCRSFTEMWYTKHTGVGSA